MMTTNKELLLLRHGKSDWDVNTDDFDRPLKDRGKRGAQRLGVWMQQQGLIPDFILSSPAERALTTAEKLCKSMGLATRDIYTDSRIYMADSHTLKRIIRECPTQAQRVLIVGHNPTLEDLLNELVDDSIKIPKDGKLLPTATLAHLKLKGDFAQLTNHSAKLKNITRASSLDKGFPYIGLNGAEFKPRPAYYYNQSGVIPYCIIENELKFLLISTSSKNRWGLPKGIVEPAYTPQASAAKEAWEEAGVEGVVGDEALGRYTH
ncbi:MAG: NUDIX domain-containing protein, partial [Methylococcaceae bacterium]|nr:NUDIX domain-containing protein [Methylococcaceae bacterium]